MLGSRVIKKILLKNYSLEKKWFILTLSICIVIYIYHTLVAKDIAKNIVEYVEEDFIKTTVSYTSERQKYAIHTSNCKIPEADTFNDEIKEYFYNVKYTNCTNIKLLTYIDKSDGVPTLKINTSLLKEYSYFKIKCCYSEIHRISYYNQADDEVRYSPCIEFQDDVVLTYPFVKVKCSNFLRNVYTNTHATVIPMKNKKPFQNQSRRANRFSVLLMGIDSISNLNLRRTMPKTYSYLKKHFHSLRGYNKIADNTFPNLMAILNGQNSEQLEKNCGEETKLNDCDIIWDAFKRLGYVTAYAEDECVISTFNNHRSGFRDSPTDYYYRPYFVASEQLGRKIVSTMTFCAGPETSGERVLNAAKDFWVSFKDKPRFGLFWMNSFSHDDVNMPSVMDVKVLEFLNDTSFKESLEDTIMIFFSDHGYRLGDIKYTYTGWLEERLPFIFVYIPKGFKINFSKKYNNFLVNTERLTTPYDLFNTLQDVLKIGHKIHKVRKSTGCPNCQSLFKEVPENRTCDVASINAHWCTCKGHIYVDPNDELVQQVAQHIVEKINKFVGSFVDSRDCAVYSLKRVVSAGISKDYVNEKQESARFFLLIIETSPHATFESTVEARIMPSQNHNLIGDINRVDTYKYSSFCVENTTLKKYCYCGGYLNTIKRVIYTTFND